MSVRDIDGFVPGAAVEQWLGEFAKKNTRAAYACGIKHFCTAVKKAPADMLVMSERDLRSLILAFQSDAVGRGVNHNLILSAITAVRSFLTSQDIHVVFRRNQLVKPQADGDSHVFTNGDLKRLWDVGGACEKALIAAACSQGWEISMFLEQERSKIESRIAHAEQNGQRFIFFVDKREKTGGTPRLCVLNPLAISCIKAYLAVRKDDDPRLFPFTKMGVQKMLQRLAKDADLKLTGNIRFHNIRKWLMSRLSRCNFNAFQIKFIMGKSIGISDLVYLQSLQEEIEEKYPRVYNDYLNICYKPSEAYSEFSKDDIELIKMVLKGIREGKVEFKP